MLLSAPEKMETISPGRSHLLLPHGMTDTALMSAGDRYEHFARLVKEQYGIIDLEAALDLMNRPVAMEGCLHRVLFRPVELRLWVVDDAPELNISGKLVTDYSTKIKPADRPGPGARPCGWPGSVCVSAAGRFGPIPVNSRDLRVIGSVR